MVLAVSWTAVAVLAVLLLTAPSSPRPCTRPSLASGDQMLRRGVIWTCTSGTWHTR